MNELDHKVAIASGWQAWEHCSKNPHENGWKIVNKHNHVVAGIRGWDTEEQAWEHALFSYNPSSDLNKAWYLAIEIPLADELFIRAIEDKWDSTTLATKLCERYVESWERSNHFSKQYPIAEISVSR